MRRLLVPAAAAGAAAVLALSGCGPRSDGQASGGAGGTAPSAVPSSASSPSSPSATARVPTLSVGPPATSKPAGTASGPTLLLDGTAEEGVEAGCVVLSAKGQQYLLIAATERVPLQVPIRVRGVVLTGVLSTCQQGTPLRVVEVSRR